MKALMAGGGLGVLAAVFLVHCGGGGGQVGCDRICDKIVSCGSDTQENCQGFCPALQAVIVEEYFQEDGRCVLDTPCATLDTKACLSQAAETAPDTNVDQLLSTFCTKRIACQNDITLEDCLIQVEGWMGFYADMLRMLRAEVADCLAGCINDDQVTCDQMLDPILGQAALDACSVQCNVALG